MIKHDIIIRYKPEITPEQKHRLIPEIAALFRSAVQEIPGLTAVQFYPNVIDRDNRYDLMIELEMDSEETLKLWDSSAVHLQWKQQYGSLLEKKAIIDRM